MRARGCWRTEHMMSNYLLFVHSYLCSVAIFRGSFTLHLSGQQTWRSSSSVPNMVSTSISFSSLLSSRDWSSNTTLSAISSPDCGLSYFMFDSQIMGSSIYWKLPTSQTSIDQNSSSSDIIFFRKRKNYDFSLGMMNFAKFTHFFQHDTQK